MERACDAGGCHNKKGDWQEGKKSQQKIPKVNNLKPANDLQPNGMTSRRQKI